jgi:hypothetical protein
MSIMIDAADQTTTSLIREAQKSKLMDGATQMDVKCTGVLVAGGPVPALAYLTPAHYSGSSNLTCTILMNVLRQQALAIRQNVQERLADNEDPRYDAGLHAQLSHAERVVANMDRIAAAMHVPLASTEPKTASSTSPPPTATTTTTTDCAATATKMTTTTPTTDADYSVTTAVTTTDNSNAAMTNEDCDELNDVNDVNDDNEIVSESQTVGELQNEPSKPDEAAYATLINQAREVEEQENNVAKATQMYEQAEALLQQIWEDRKMQRQQDIANGTLKLDKEKLSSWPSRLYLQMDNAAGDNKNQYVFAFLGLLVYYHVFDVVTHWQLHT